jgi:uncharacterized protein YbjT (DUF2867 family)
MATSKAYVDSTMEAEGLVRASGLPAVIARPSIVTGDSGTGWSPRPRCLGRLPAGPPALTSGAVEDAYRALVTRLIGEGGGRFRRLAPARADRSSGGPA